MEDGYESIFQVDLDSSSTIGMPTLTDSNNDGLVDDTSWKSYRVFDPSAASPFIRDSKGRRISVPGQGQGQAWRKSFVQKVVSSQVSQQFNEDFSSGQTGNLWKSITGSQGINSKFGGRSNSLFFGLVGGSSTQRQATTIDINAFVGGTVSFEFINGNSKNGGEQVDPGEEVVFEYSTNGGNFKRIKKFTRDKNYSWTLHSEDMPNDVNQTTSFRWRQLNHSGSPFDHWALDNISITSYQSMRHILVKGTSNRSGDYKIIKNTLSGDYVDETNWISGHRDG